MIEILLIGVVSFSISMLSLYSGFGLGTIMMPVFALFFPLPVAIASTAIVHLLNNIFKVFLIGIHADFRTLIRFALPGAIAAIGGAFVLTFFDSIAPIFNYNIGLKNFEVTVVKTCIGGLILSFSILELTSKFSEIHFSEKYLPIGGLISGFFGGLSGHQGAFRSAFLIKLGLSKEVFIATNVVSAVIVDISRLTVYGISFYSANYNVVKEQGGMLVIIAIIMAFLGTWFGKKLLKKMTIKIIQKIIGLCLLLLGTALLVGLI